MHCARIIEACKTKRMKFSDPVIQRATFARNFIILIARILIQLLVRLSKIKFIGSPSGECYPLSSTICGSQGCENAAYIWLTEDERNEYYDGRRVFAFATAAVKVRVKDDALMG